MAEIEAATLARLLTMRHAAGMAQEISELVRSGSLPPGTRLPTIREVAEQVGVSVGTVAEAWAQLRRSQMVITRRRGGTWIAPPEQSSQTQMTKWSSVDLLFCSPDPRLQPSIHDATLKALEQPAVNSWGREYIVQSLQNAVEKSWPFPAQAWTAAGGGTEGLWLATRAAAEAGDVIAVEEPVAPGYLGTLKDMGLNPIGIPVDEEGPRPEALSAALNAGATAFVYAPGGPFSDRHVLSEARVAELRVVLEGTEVSLVEDDALGPLSTVPVLSLGQHFPERTIRVFAFCRAFGMDLRTSVVAGAKPMVDRVITARSGGVASNSRLLQHATAAMLTSRKTQRLVRTASERYSIRRRMTLNVFAEHGIPAISGEGSLVVWIDVPNEQAAALALGSEGVIVDVGSTSFVSPQASGRLRLSVTQLPEEKVRLTELAQLISRAAAGALRTTFV